MSEMEDFIRVINKLDNICENDIIKAQKEKLLKQDKEIERLNNIINELEKWLNYEMDENYTDRTIDEYNVYAYCFTKLKELKGSDKA